MSDDTAFRNLVLGLAENLVEGELAFDDEGRATLNVTDELAVGIDHLPETDQVVVYAELGELTDGPAREAAVRDLLHDSLSLAASLGGALGVDRETGAVALFARRSAAGLDQAAFEDWLGDIAGAGEAWQVRLRTAQPADDAA